jgi:hypothetical protein
MTATFSAQQVCATCGGMLVIWRPGQTSHPQCDPGELALIKSASTPSLPSGNGRHPPELSTETALDLLRTALIDSAGLDRIPTPEPLINNILFRNSIAWIIGAPGNGKSFVALDMAGAVGTGKPWQTNPVTQGPVLYLVAEGVAGTKDRVRAWEASNGMTMEGVKWLPVAIQTGNDAQWATFTELCAEMCPALIVLDTQARITVGMEENAAKDMGVFVHRLESLRIATGACVLVVHHVGRNGDHMRGSTALDGAAVTIIRVSKADDRISVECGKQKDTADFDNINLRLIPYGSSAIMTLIGEGFTDLSGQPAVRKMLSSWWECHESDPVSISVLVKSTGVAEATFHRNKKALVKQGILATEGRGRSVLYRLIREPDHA